MIVAQSKKGVLAKIGKGSLLILAGIAVGIIGFAIFLIRSQPQLEDLNEIKLQYTVQYIKTEQQRLGIDCHALRKNINEFLISDVQPVLNVRKLRHDSNMDFSQVVRKKMGGMRDDYFACGHLYHAAQSVQWNGLNDLNFTVMLDREIITLNTFIRFGECEVNCNASYLDKKFNLLQDSVLNIQKRIGDGAELNYQ